MIARRERKSKILLVVAPSLYQCRKTLDAFGIPVSRISDIRSVTKALQLRGWSRGTPFIATVRDQWFASQQGAELSMALDAMMLDGRLRVASQIEIDELSNAETMA
ncbi:hypothetical protein [Agrobacterium rosae]|uniref:hypothetical protein n=1 Tax=Agrobacterium rosae TaxID=1972867 RepID=UPI003BA09B38